MASLADGHWTNPYYDCGGGEIWMVTYSAPILKVKDGKAVFQLVSTMSFLHILLKL
jgi:G protein-coupled receptor 158